MKNLPPVPCGRPPSTTDARTASDRLSARLRAAHQNDLPRYMMSREEILGAGTIRGTVRRLVDLCGGDVALAASWCRKIGNRW